MTDQSIEPIKQADERSMRTFFSINPKHIAVAFTCYLLAENENRTPVSAIQL